MGAPEPAEHCQQELAELLDDCGELAMWVCAERQRLLRRLETLFACTGDLERGVRQVREAAARHRSPEPEIERLRGVQATLRAELASVST
ncbi:MAG TPA: hypothetical protein VF533_16300 [Solirubrobacteraceae bacterium]|jgi:hypothetical protein